METVFKQGYADPWRGQQLVPDRASFQRRIVIFKNVKRNKAGDIEKKEHSSISTHMLWREYTNSMKAG